VSPRRGSAFITVLAVLALLAILMEMALQLLVSHVSESRRRGDSAYAGELARSGLAWARACIAARGGACSARVTVGGGVMDVRSTFDGEVYTVTSRGIVLRGGADGPSREATTQVRPPPPEESTSAAPPLPETPSPRSGEPAPPRRDSDKDLRVEETPRYF
jgi:hypothetical protein